ncbi:MAG: hypothetical protein AAFN92_14895, partial [Bacteroidota bacterium]
MRYYLLTTLLLCLLASGLDAQKKKNETKEEEKDPRYETAWNSLSFRSIGPAFTSGRIADFAVNPDNPSEFYVATAA